MSLYVLIESATNLIVNIINYEDGDAYTPPTGYMLKEVSELEELPGAEKKFPPLISDEALEYLRELEGE
jgi:hypothetical protein